MHLLWSAAATVLLATGPAVPAHSLEKLDADSPLYRQAFPQIVKWRSAIVARNILGLVSFAYPENREWMSVLLTNPKSTQYISAFSDSPASLRSHLLPRTGVVLFEQLDLPYSRNGLQYVMACFVTADEERKPWPDDSAALKEFAQSAGVPCQLFMNARGDWFAEPAVLNGWY
jgi:hypothetical protein